MDWFKNNIWCFVIQFMVMAFILMVSAAEGADTQAKGDLSSALVDCDRGYQAYLKGDKSLIVMNAMVEKQPEAEREAFKIVCISYVTGYERGVRAQI